MNMEQSVPKRQHINFRRRGITQKKAYNKLCLLSEIIEHLYSEMLFQMWQQLVHTGSAGLLEIRPQNYITTPNSALKS